MNRSKTQRLESLVNELEKKMEHLERLQSSVSKGSVGWHVEHSLLVLNTIIKAMDASNPTDYRSTFSFAKHYVLTFRKIPRGRIQAPKSVRPAEGFTADSIKQHFTTAHSALGKLEAFEKNKFFKHPFFGSLNKKAAIRFLEIHTSHHLGIINDIVKAQNL